jgi:hypothetical protein
MDIYARHRTGHGLAPSVSLGTGFELHKPKGDGLEPVAGGGAGSDRVLILDGTSFPNCDSK